MLAQEQTGRETGNLKISKHQRSEILEWLPNRKQQEQKPFNFEVEIDKFMKGILQHNFLQLQKRCTP